MSTSSTDRDHERSPAGGLLLHPIALAATALLWINDHYWKATHPGLVTGKLSDLAGMVVFPLLVTGLLELMALAAGRRLRCGPRGVAIAAALTGVAFVAIKVSPAAADAYRFAFGLRWLAEGWLLRGATEVPRVRHTMDPTDLVALPLLLVPVWLAWRRAKRGDSLRGGEMARDAAAPREPVAHRNGGGAPRADEAER